MIGAASSSPAHAAAPWHAHRAVFLVREAGLWLLLYPLYLLTREGAIGSLTTALRHAREIVDAERSLGIAIERGVQQVSTAVPLVSDALDVFYEWAFYPLLAVALVWLGLTHRELYVHTRRALIVALALAAILFLLFPTAPPRMLPDLGIADTVGMGAHDVDSFHGISFNPYAAMPSMHVGWSLIVAAGVYHAVSSPWVRRVAIVHPLLMTLATIATGNHYVLDCAAGAAIGLLALRAVGAPGAEREPRDTGLRVPAPAGAAGRHG